MEEKQGSQASGLCSGDQADVRKVGIALSTISYVDLALNLFQRACTPSIVQAKAAF